MSISKEHVVLFFRRNPALRVREKEVLSQIRNSDLLSEKEIKLIMGEELFGFLAYDMEKDEPVIGGGGRAWGDRECHQYVSVTLAYVP